MGFSDWKSDLSQQEWEWRWRKQRAFSFKMGAATQVANSGITLAAHNQTTGITGICTEDGRVILAPLKALQQGTAGDLAAVNLSMDGLAGLVWISNHEFVVAGLGGNLLMFNVVTYESEAVYGDGSAVYATIKRDDLLYVGSLNGLLRFYDARMIRKEVGCISHEFKRQRQPVCSLDAAGNYVYTATPLRGRVWLWDLRNLKARLAVAETGRYPCSLRLVDAGLCSGMAPHVLSDAGVVRLDPTLVQQELIYSDKNEVVCRGSQLHHSHQRRHFAWNRRGEACLWDGREFAKAECKGLAGIEQMGKGVYLLYTDAGKAIVGEACHSFKCL